MSKLVTLKQALVLKELGFKENTSMMYVGQLGPTIAAPTVDEAIDWIRRRFRVIVYNIAAPYVDPVEKRIKYGYRVKFCNIKWGWNQREMLERGIWSADCYAAKRSAIWIALRYILKNKENAKKRRNRRNRRK